jgi:hypothetical protein
MEIFGSGSLYQWTQLETLSDAPANDDDRTCCASRRDRQEQTSLVPIRRKAISVILHTA